MSGQAFTRLIVHFLICVHIHKSEHILQVSGQAFANERPNLISVHSWDDPMFNEWNMHVLFCSIKAVHAVTQWISDTFMVHVSVSHTRRMQLHLCRGLRRHRVQPDISDPLQKWGDYGEWLYDLQSPPAIGRRKGESCWWHFLYTHTNTHTSRWSRENRGCHLAACILSAAWLWNAWQMIAAKAAV